VLIVCKKEAAAFAAVVITKLAAIIAEICKNPSNPKFNHYAFDSVAVLIR
jgi:exportin-2 (importin alpha re-exporter)